MDFRDALAPQTRASRPEVIVDRAIRLATPADATAIQAIYAPVVRETAISFEWEPPTVEQMAERIEATLTRFPYLVLERAGEVCGYAYASAFRARAAYDWSVETTIYLAADARGHGVGRALYESLVATVRLLGYRQAYAGITLPNPASIALHERVGFTPAGVYERAGYKFGQWHSVGWWQLMLPLPEGDPAPPVPLPALVEIEGFEDALAAGLPYLRD
jgi:phosphinothricin acetyltransferase